jgi:hypothetical protein
MEGVYSSFRWVDEGRSAAASTAVVESSCHVNVNDVDAAVLGGFNRIASDHDERVGVASATSAYRSVRRPPSTLSPAGGTASSASALLIAVWHCLGVGARPYKLLAPRRDPNQPLRRSESPALCRASAPTTGPWPHRTSLPRCSRRWRGDGSGSRRRARRDSRSGSAGSCKVVLGRAPTLSRGIGVAQRNVLANADSMCGGRQRGGGQDSGQAGYKCGHQARQEAPPRAVMAGKLSR